MKNRRGGLSQTGCELAYFSGYFGGTAVLELLGLKGARFPHIFVCGGLDPLYPLLTSE